MTKKDLAKAIADELGIPSGVALQTVQRTFDGITEALIQEGRIEAQLRRLRGEETQAEEWTHPTHWGERERSRKNGRHLQARAGDGGADRPVEEGARREDLIPVENNPMAIEKATNKSEFIRKALGKDASLNLKHVNDLWSRSGGEGEITTVLFYQVRRKMGLKRAEYR